MTFFYFSRPNGPNGDGTVSDEISSAGFLNEDSLTHAYSPYLGESFGKTKDFHEFLKKQKDERPYEHKQQNQLWKRTGLGTDHDEQKEYDQSGSLGTKLPQSRVLQKKFNLFAPNK